MRNQTKLGFMVATGGFVVACIATSCSGGLNGGAKTGGSGGSNPAGAGGASIASGSTSGSGAAVGVGTFAGSSGAGGGDAGACQHLAVQFVPKIPLVYVLADRSGSSFDSIMVSGMSTTAWDVLRTATLSVIQNLQSQVDFGFGDYTGINPNTTAGMCPIIDAVPPALNNYTAIQAKYTTSATAKPNFKAETPAALSLAIAGQTLNQAASMLADAGAPGGKYILWATDGETDFCDDGSCICPADAVIAAIQSLSNQGIQTLVLGLPSNICQTGQQALQAMANAGAGLPTQAPPLNAPTDPPTSPVTIWQQCNSRPGWMAAYKAAGLPAAGNTALATYATTAPTMNATLYKPDPTNVTDLTNKISMALATVKSCSFDLQGKIKVDLTKASEGHVSIDGMAVPYDPTNGWTMSSATTLELVGAACQKWRSTGMNISFDFPCDILIMTT
jgi:hypothetical protein